MEKKNIFIITGAVVLLVIGVLLGMTIGDDRIYHERDLEEIDMEGEVNTVIDRLIVAEDTFLTIRDRFDDDETEEIMNAFSSLEERLFSLRDHIREGDVLHGEVADELNDVLRELGDLEERIGLEEIIEEEEEEETITREGDLTETESRIADVEERVLRAEERVWELRTAEEMSQELFEELVAEFVRVQRDVDGLFLDYYAGEVSENEVDEELQDLIRRLEELEERF